MKAANPGADVRTVFTGSFEDVAAAKTAALALADQGCDFLFQNADNAALGVFSAAAERGIRAFGSNRDQNALSPAILASAVIDMPRAFVETARRVKEGRFDGTPLRYGLASGVISFVWSPTQIANVPPAVVEEVARVEGRDRVRGADRAPGELLIPLLELCGISKSFGATQALDRRRADDLRGRDPRPPRRERSRQVDARFDRSGRSPGRWRRGPPRRPGGPLPVASGGTTKRNRPRSAARPSRRGRHRVRQSRFPRPVGRLPREARGAPGTRPPPNENLPTRPRPARSPGRRTFRSARASGSRSPAPSPAIRRSSSSTSRRRSSPPTRRRPFSPRSGGAPEPGRRSS